MRKWLITGLIILAVGSLLVLLDRFLMKYSLEYASSRTRHLSHSRYNSVIRPGLRLENIDLSNSELSNCRIPQSDLRNASLAMTILIDADLSRSNLTMANLSGANLTGANIRKALLQGTLLHNANMERADLRSSQIYEADLSTTNLKNAQLDGVISDRITRWPPGFSPRKHGVTIIGQ